MRRLITTDSSRESINVDSSRRRPTARANGNGNVTADREKKKRVCYCMVALVLVFQVVIFPSLFAHPPPRSPTALTDSIQPPGLRIASETTEQVQPKASKPADGTFNNYPIHLKTDNPFHSTVHCVGETHDAKTAWMYRSCEFTQVCLDTATKDFYVVDSPAERQFQQKRVAKVYSSTELSSANLTLALGGINPRWVGDGPNMGIEKVQWFPKRLPEPPSSYYALDDNVVLVPFHSFAAHNVGHMLWDDFLPIYTLLQLFFFIHPPTTSATKGDDQGLQTPQHLLLRVDTLPTLYATCEMQKKKGKKLRKCAANFEKFLPMLGVDPATFTTLSTLQFQPSSSSNTGVTMVCAKHAVAGLGMLTDHGLKDHGWLMPKETHTVQNTAKGPLLYQFRNYVLQNLGLSLLPPPNNAPSRIVLSEHSSEDGQRNTHFIDQRRILSHAFPTTQVQTVELATLGMREQFELVSQTQVFVTTCGGGAMTATFLPKGATLILYYAEDGGYDFRDPFNMTGDPAFLDWDLFNNMAYLHVHWLPIGTMHSKEGFDALMYLIHHELDVMESTI